MASQSFPSQRIRDFVSAGHLPTLLTAFLYFDFCFAIWVLNGAMAPFITAEFHLSAAQTGLATSVPVLVGAVMRLPIGVVAQHVGRKTTAMASMLLIVAGLLAGMFLVDSLTGVLVMSIVLGIGGASFGVALSLGAGSYPRRYKGLAMGIAGAGNSGAVLAMLFAPPLAAAHGWRTVYGIATLPVLVAFVLMWIFAREPEDRDPHQKLADYGKLVANRDLWVLTFVYSVTFGGYIGLTSFLPTFFNVQYGVDKAHIGPYVAFAILAGSLLRVVGGWLSDRFGGLVLLRGLLVAIGGLALVAAALPGPFVMVALLIFCFAAMGAGNGAVFQLVPLRFAAITAVAGGLIGEISALAGGALPGLMGLARERVGSFAPGFVVLGGFAALALATLALTSRAWQRTWLAHGTAAPAVAAEPEPATLGAEVA
jgi:NNP family nitrate/nitrite transporter-like MFS transporter